MAQKMLDKEIFIKGLYNFGVTYNNYTHAYLSMNLSNQELISIGGITNYKYIQEVNISHNELSSLEQLSGLNHLTILNASYNKITEIMDLGEGGDLFDFIVGCPLGHLPADIVIDLLILSSVFFLPVRN